jgi:outer membrane protein
LAINFAIFFLQANAQITTIDKAIELAKANNLQINLQKIELNLANNNLLKNISNFLPNINANFSHQQRNSFFLGQGYDKSTKQNLQELTIDQPIFNGFNSFLQYGAAKENYYSSLAKNNEKVQEISFLATQTYCNLWRYQQLENLQKNNKILANNLLNLAKDRNKLGLVDKIMINQILQENLLLEEDFLLNLNLLHKEQENYQNIIGQIHANLELPQINYQKINQDEITTKILLQNYQIKLQQHQYLAAQKQYQSSISNFSPRISAIGSISRQSNVVYLNNQSLNSKSLSLNFSVPIFQKGLEYANFIEAKQKQNLAQENLKIMMSEISKIAKQSIISYNYLIEINQINHNSLKLAKQQLEILSQRAKIEDPITIIRSKINQNNQEIKLINSQIDLAIHHYKIKYLLAEI